MTFRPQNENAVVFVCDQNYVRFALFVIWQISHHNPARSFDFVIYSPDEITLPDWAASWGVLVHRAKPLESVPETALFRGSAITLYRFGMARDLGGRYRRIIYMDCDMAVEGGDFDRLLQADLGGHPVAGVLDAMFLVRAGYHAKEYIAAGLPALPYMNAGFQVIDTRAYQEQEIEQCAMALLRTASRAITTADQSLLNLVLKGRFAELSPVWNWQRNIGLPLVTMRFPVFVRHFIDKEKPDTDSSGSIDARFNLAYREFFARHEPEYLARLALPCDPAPMSWRDGARMVWKHMLLSDLCRRMIARHPDPYRPRLPPKSA